MFNKNLIQLTGNVTDTPETRTAGGTTVTRARHEKHERERQTFEQSFPAVEFLKAVVVHRSNKVTVCSLSELSWRIPLPTRSRPECVE